MNKLIFHSNCHSEVKARQIKEIKLHYSLLKLGIRRVSNYNEHASGHGISKTLYLESPALATMSLVPAMSANTAVHPLSFPGSSVKSASINPSSSSSSKLKPWLHHKVWQKKNHVKVDSFSNINPRCVSTKGWYFVRNNACEILDPFREKLLVNCAFNAKFNVQNL